MGTFVGKAIFVIVTVVLIVAAGMFTMSFLAGAGDAISSGAGNLRTSIASIGDGVSESAYDKEVARQQRITQNVANAADRDIAAKDGEWDRRITTAEKIAILKAADQAGEQRCKEKGLDCGNTTSSGVPQLHTSRYAAGTSGSQPGGTNATFTEGWLANSCGGNTVDWSVDRTDPTHPIGIYNAGGANANAAVLNCKLQQGLVAIDGQGKIVKSGETLTGKTAIVTKIS